MTRPGNRHVLGLLVMALVLLSDAIAIAHAIELERLFNAASSTCFGRMRTGAANDIKASKTTTTTTTTCTDSNHNHNAATITSAASASLFSCRVKNAAQKEKERTCRTNHQQCKLCAASSSEPSSPACSALLSSLPSTKKHAILEIRGGHNHHSHSSTASSQSSKDYMISAAPHSTPYGIPLFAWKIIFQFFLTAINVLCWYIPLKHKSLRENDLGLSLANAFSGGVFLSLAFGHLIPECVAGFPPGYGETFPYMMILAGYLLIFFIEKVAFDVHVHDVAHHIGHHQPTITEATTTTDDKIINGTADSPMSTSITNGQPHSNTATATITAPAATSGRSAIILLAALAVHSILEMVSLGLANSFGDAALLALSIALHQPAESIALLVAFLKSGMKHNQIITYLSIFSAMGPIGVGLGMLVSQFATPLADAIMLGIVAGTFVYVGATEVIPEEWESQEHKWKKFFALMSGIISIFVITRYTMSLEL